MKFILYCGASGVGVQDAYDLILSQAKEVEYETPRD